MKTSFIFILISALSFFNTNAQSLRFEKSFELAQEKSAAVGKPLFVLVSGPEFKGPNQSWGLDNSKVVNFFNTNFINYKASMQDSTFFSIRKKHALHVFPSYLFFDKSGNMIFRSDRRLSDPEVYLRMGNEALKAAIAPKNHNYFIEQHKKGALSQQEIKEYILLRKHLGISDNSDLADDYVHTLSVKDLGDYKTVLFILSSGPTYDSDAYKLAHANRKIIDSIYKTEPYSKRSEINHTIIRNTSRKAIETKNHALAQSIARFAQNVHGPNYAEGYRIYESQLLDYYKAVKDTTNFLRSLGRYFDQYYRLSADSIRKLDIKAKEANVNRSAAIRIKGLKDSLSSRETSMRGSEQFSVSGGPQPVSGRLNNAAWDVYLTGTKTTEYLEKAIRWTRKAISLNPVPAYYDTLAHLLYRSGLYEEAELHQQKAINLASNPPFLVQREKMKAELKLMKAKKL